MVSQGPLIPSVPNLIYLRHAFLFLPLLLLPLGWHSSESTCFLQMLPGFESIYNIQCQTCTWVMWVEYFLLVFILCLKMNFAEMKTFASSSVFQISHCIIKTNNAKFNIWSAAVKVWKIFDESI